MPSVIPCGGGHHQCLRSHLVSKKKVHKSTKYSERDTKQEDNNIHYRDGLIVEKSLRGRGEMSGYLFRYSLGDIPMILLKYLPNTDWEGKFRVSLIC